ncbi:putative nitrite transporter [Platanthera zijinensis]|uniref:Nitrite transporter n=1 Tax=Platanthera zijinensis TaxID=2320716 RepID=A0AAP0FZF8_9ASPA
MAEEGIKEKEKQKKLGGLKTLPFILSNELCDRFAGAGFHANMINYLMNQLHMPLIESTKTLNNFAATSSLTPIVGALIADSFAGRFWTITTGSIFYLLGMVGVTISSILPTLRPPACLPQSASCQEASTWQQAFFYVSLLLTAIGSGGIRPCVVPFGAEQLEQDGPSPPQKPDGKQPKQQWSFFNLYFFCVGLAIMLAFTVVVYVQDNVGWGVGFGIPTITMFIAVIVFTSGYPLYIKRKPGGSPLTRVAQVVVAAARKRKLPAFTDGSLLYHDKDYDAHISTAGCLAHTKQFKFLDRAAIVVDGDMSDSGQPRPWHLATVHRIEELKSIIRILPIWSTVILISTAASNNYTFAIVQAKTMDCHVAGSFKIPPATLSIFSSAAMLLTIAFYDRVLVPIARRLTGRPEGISHLRRVGIGLAISILSNVAAALVESRRRADSAHGQLSVFWLVPQYVVHGMADGFASVGLLEFLYDQSPESMRSTATALFWLSISAGQYGGTVLVSMVSKFTRSSGTQGSWLQDNINEGRLDCFYWLVAGLQLFNFAYFLFCAKFYVFKRLETAFASGDIVHDNFGDDDLEPGKNFRSTSTADRDQLELTQSNHVAPNHV